MTQSEPRASRFAKLPLALGAATWASVFAGLACILVNVADIEALGADDRSNGEFFWLGLTTLFAFTAVGLSLGTLFTSALALERVRRSGGQVSGYRFTFLGALIGISGGLVVSPIVLVTIGVVLGFVMLVLVVLLGGGGLGHGRPLSGRRLRAVVPIGVRGRPRDLAAGRAWARSAIAEHESIEAFERLADDLATLGAPDDLVRRARRAAREEADHAERCLALAGRHLGLRLAPVSLGAAARAATLEDVADGCLNDGLVGEGFAAAVAAEAALRVDDPETAETLRVIAVDEASHAALSEDILRWAIARGARPSNGATPAPFPTRPAEGGLPRADQDRLVARLRSRAAEVRDAL